MRIFIEPIDPLIFRTGRPFDAGQDNFAESLFPPTPETIQGAIRAMIATYWDAKKTIAAAFADPELVKLIGDRNHYGRFRLTGYTLGRYSRKHPEKVERLLPVPAHIMQADAQIYRLSPRPLDEKVLTNFPDGIHHYLAPDQQPEEELKPLEGWITENDLYRVLGKDDLKQLAITKRSEVYSEEARLGIALQHETKATAEGFLYQMIMIRMNHLLEHPYIYGFVVDIRLATPAGDALIADTRETRHTQHTLHLPDEGWMTIGGEQRAAYFRVLPSDTSHAPIIAREHSLLYLATPASFDQGWRPSAKLAPFNAPLAAAIQRYEFIGGWKLNPGDAKGENKAMRRCVPAGSVYFYHQRIDQLQALTDHNQEIGYGICYEGEW